MLLRPPLSEPFQLQADRVNVMPNVSIYADSVDLRRASTWLEAICAEHHVPASQVARLDLCLHEVLANIVIHGAGTTSHSLINIDFRVQRSDGTHVAEVTVSDAGPAFDPLAVEVPPRPLTLSEAEPGGLGLVMIRSFADDLSYRYIDGCNKLAFSVTWNQAGAIHG